MDPVSFVIKSKRMFKKGYLPNWTEEVFTVVKCIETRPPVYLVKDDHGPCHSVPFTRLTLQTSTPRFCRSCLDIQLLMDSGYPNHFTKYCSGIHPVHGYRSQHLQLDGRIGELYFEDGTVEELFAILVTLSQHQVQTCFIWHYPVTAPWITFQTSTPRFCRSCLDIQLLMDSGYPNHFTKYCTLLPFRRFFGTLWILYTSSFTSQRVLMVLFYDNILQCFFVVENYGQCCLCSYRRQWEQIDF
jgi:hypothetical protein